MVTKCLIETPFGSKFIYQIDGDYAWSEYIQFDRVASHPVSLEFVFQMRKLWRALTRSLQLS